MKPSKLDELIDNLQCLTPNSNQDDEEIYEWLREFFEAVDEQIDARIIFDDKWEKLRELLKDRR